VWFVPKTSVLQFGRPARATCTQIPNGRGKRAPVFVADRGGTGAFAISLMGSAASAMKSRTRCAEVGPTPGMSCIRRKPATRSRGFSTKPNRTSRRRIPLQIPPISFNILKRFFGNLSGTSPIHVRPSVYLKADLDPRGNVSIPAKYLINLARPKRFELLTPRFVVWCSPN
jgi:hypothetical protein